jgi:hypothetical protein
VGWEHVTLTGDVTPAGWIAERLHPFGQDVGSVVPTGFAAYVRITNGQSRNGVLGHDQAGAVAGTLSKHTSRPDACWFCLWDGYGYLHRGGMAWFVFARPPFARIRRGFRRLRLRWSRPRVSHLRAWPRVRLPNRDYLLFRGSIAQAAGWQDGPNLWWPDDRAWCVASEIDLVHTYVGGSKALIADLIAGVKVEASPATVEDGIGQKATD